jgi:hypothetical protein
MLQQNEKWNFQIHIQVLYVKKISEIGSQVMRRQPEEACICFL